MRKAPFILFFLILLAVGVNAWWDSDYSYKQKLTLDTSVLAGNVTDDLPVAVIIASDNTAFWSHVKTNGEDVRFVAADDTTALKYHFEKFNHTTDDMIAWVKVTDTFDSSSDIDIYMYYGYDSATDGQDEVNTYNSDFEAVYHMNDASGGIDDATGTHDGTAAGTPVYAQTGHIGDAIYFAGTDEWFNLGFEFDAIDTITVITWIKKDVADSTPSFLGDYSGEDGLKMANSGNNFYPMVGNGIVRKQAAISGGDTTDWQMFTLIYDGIEINGFINTTKGTGVAITGNVNATTGDYYLGAADHADEAVTPSPLVGLVDETWFLSTVLNDNAINLVYLSFTDNLMTFGGEEEKERDSDADINAWFGLPSSGSTVSGTYSVDFNLQVSDDNEMAVSLYLSNSALGWDYPVFLDYNILDFDNNADFDCDNADFSDSTNCTYLWDSWKMLSQTSDGTKYLDLNTYVANGVYDENVISSQGFTYNNEPNYDSNIINGLVTGILDEDNGTTTVTITANSNIYTNNVTVAGYAWDENGSSIASTQNLNYSTGTYGDRNYALTVTYNYDYNADTFTDTNSIVLHIQTYPQDVNFTWDPIAPAADANVSYYGTASGSEIMRWNYGFTSPDANVYDQNASHIYTSAGLKTTCLTVQNWDDLNRTTCWDLNVNGHFKIQFWDENSDVKVAPTTLTFNDVNYLSKLDVNGLIEFDLNDWITGSYTINAGLTDYTTRNWTIDLNSETAYDENYGLLKTSWGNNIEFQMYLTDESTLVTNTRITASLTDYNFISGIVATDSSGKVNFFLNPNDENYQFAFTYAGTDYTYIETVVTVKIPRDEETNLDVNGYDIHVGGLATQDYNGLFTDKTLHLFSDTTDFHFLDINSSGYIERSYSLQFKGGTAAYTLQPYLISESSGYVVHFHTLDDYAGSGLGGILLVLKKSISGEGLVTVESIESDSAGKATLSAIAGDLYTLLYYSEGILIATHNYRLSETEYWVAINLWNIDYSSPTRRGVYATFNPAFSAIRHSSPFSITTTIYSEWGEISSIHEVIWHYDRNLVNTTTSGAAIAYGTTLSHSFNPTDLNAGSSIMCKYTITLTDGNIIFLTKSYTFIESGSSGDIITTMQIDMREAFACSTNSDPCAPLILIALFVAVAIAAGLGTMARVDLSGMSIIICGVLGMFVIMNWVPFGLWVIMVLAAIVVYMSRKRVER